MIKKITAFILSALLLLQLTPSLAFSDTDETQYEQAVNVLSELGITDGYKDKTFRPEGDITRAEFAAMVVRLLDTSLYTIPEEQIFSDVDDDHWAFEFVNAGFHIGYFSGYGDGIFAPEEKITFSEVVKTVVTILGYKPLAEAKGSYPTGYIMIANEKDLLDGLSLGNDEYVTRGDVAILLYNSLNQPKLEQTVFGDDTIKYTEDPRRTILTDELKVARYEGIVTATRHSGLYGMAELGKDEVSIEGTELAVGKSDISSYLGYNLVVYAKEDAKSKDETVLFYEIKEENIATTIVADDIDASSNLTSFVWWEDDEQETVNLSDDVQVIINAKYEPFALSSDIRPLSGTVTLLNNDDDKDIDVIVVKQYSHYVVGNIDTTDLVIFDKYGKAPLELEPSGKTVDYKILRNGSNAKFKNISEGSVLSVCKSVDGEYMEIHLVATPVRGAVTGIVDADTYIIGEDGNGYKRSCDLPDTELIEMGYEGTFYLDIEGRIIKIDAAGAVDGKYCYLINAGKGVGLDGRLQFKILNSKGDIEVLSAAQKVSFNGSKRDDDTILSYLGGAGTITQQPLRYAVNASGELSNIEIPTKDFDAVERLYRRSTKMFGYGKIGYQYGSFFISSEDTVMFQVPTGGGDDDAYKVIKYDDLATNGVEYSVTGYDLDGLTVGCAVIDVPDAVGSAEITGNCCVLTAVTQVIDDDGDTCYKLYYMQDGKKQETMLSDKAVLSHYDISVDPTNGTTITPADLKPGDVFHIKLDSNKNINSVARVLSVGGTTLSQAPHFNYGRGTSKGKAFGVVKTRIGSGMMLYVDGIGDCLYDLTKPSGDLYMYDSRSKTVTVISPSDIIDIQNAPGDPAYAYVRCHTGVVNDVIVFYQSK